MSQIENAGEKRGLDEVFRQFLELVDAASLPEPQPFVDWCQQILVDHPEKSALVLPAGTVISADLLLDRDAEPFLSRGISTLMVPGDLTVTGRLINADTEEGPFLLVGGNLCAGELIKGAAGMIVVGSVEVSGVALLDGDNGALLVGQDFTARGLIDCDHDILVAGDVKASVASDDLGNMRAMLVPDVFDDPEDPTNEWPEGDLIRARMLEGLPVLRTA